MKSYIIISLGLIFLIFERCNMKSEKVQLQTLSGIDSFKISEHPTIGPNSFVFSLSTNDTILMNLFYKRNYDKIKICGSIFSDSSFYFGSPYSDFNKDSNDFIVYLTSSNLIEYSQKQLDSISRQTIKDIHIKIKKGSKIWDICKCK